MPDKEGVEATGTESETETVAEVTVPSVNEDNIADKIHEKLKAEKPEPEITTKPTKTETTKTEPAVPVVNEDSIADKVAEKLASAAKPAEKKDTKPDPKPWTERNLF